MNPSGAVEAYLKAVAASDDEGTVGEKPADADAGAATAANTWAVYLLHCAGGKSYIGISPTPDERFEVHRTGKGAAFTRANRPHTLAAVVWFESRSAAASMEVRLKALSRPAKLAWFERFPATTPATPSTLDAGIASLAQALA